MKFGGNAIVYGLLAATYPASQLIGSPIQENGLIYTEEKNSSVE